MQGQRMIIVAVFVVFWIALGLIAWWRYLQGQMDQVYYCLAIMAIDMVGLPILLWKTGQGPSGRSRSGSN